MESRCIFTSSSNTKHAIMKIAAKHIEAGMTIKYAGHRKYSCSEYPSANCGGIKKSSPVIKVKSVNSLTQQFKHNKGVLVTTECGLLIEFSTRIKVEVI